MNEVSDSKFQKWRAIVAMVHADQHVAPEEREFVNGYLERIPFTEAQREQLKAELETGVAIDPIIEKITDKADRSLLIHFARMLCYKDGELHPAEAAVLAKLNSSIIQGVDVQAEAVIAHRMTLTQKLQADSADKKGMLARFFELFGVDLN